jgi:protein-disulfide isomerase
MSDALLTPPVSERDHATGPEDAPVTLVEYGDFECPYCGMAYKVVKSAQQDLGKQLQFVFRHFPLAEAHPHARNAAQAAEAAAAQGKFWEMPTCCSSIRTRSRPRTLLVTRSRWDSTWVNSLRISRTRLTRSVCATIFGAALGAE